MITENPLRKRALKNATSYSEWSEAALNYDKKNGLDRWRKSDETSQYDYVSVRMRLDRLRGLKSRHDISGLLYNLNEGIHGNVGGMGKASLYSHALSGTKHLISDYIEEVVHALELIDKDDSGEISFEEKLDFFRRASHCFGRSALMLSGSGSLLYYHLGVARALFDQDLLPRVLSGSSGGSLAGSLICSHTDKELVDILTPEFFIDRLPAIEPKTKNSDRGASLHQALELAMPDLTFQQAFEKSGRSMNVTISPAEQHQTSRLLNAVASPAVLIHSAVRASCAVPGFFDPVTLEALDKYGERVAYLPQRSWVDGAVTDDLPAKRLGRLFGVNHTIVSQTNPAAIPIARRSERKRNTLSLLHQGSQRASRELFNTWATILDGSKAAPRGITRLNSMVRALINQEYVGDINVIADHKFINPLSLLEAPDEKRLRKLFDMGERCTWPKLEMIRQQSRISRKLDSLLGHYEQNQVETLHTKHLEVRKTA